MNNCEIEEWRPIAGFKHYEVSNFGNVRSVGHWRKSKGDSVAWHQGKTLKSQKSIHGYLRIGLQCGDGTMRTMSVHRLVAEAFIPNPNNWPEINHLDEDKTNNKISNLEWSTASHNINWGTRNMRVASKMERPIVMIRLSDGQERVFKSVAEAKRLGFTPGKGLYHQDNNKTRCDGCCWKYLDDKNFVLPQYKSWKKPIVGRSIIDDSVITFESIHEANRNGYTRESIKRAIRNGNAYRNYLWSLM